MNPDNILDEFLQEIQEQQGVIDCYV